MREKSGKFVFAIAKILKNHIPMENQIRSITSSLLERGVVILRPGEPFTWASGILSPIYCDNRRILGDVALREKVVGALSSKVDSLYPDCEVVAGVATGAIAWGALVAATLGKPFVYVRTKAKDHGTKSRLEGAPVDGRKVAVVEDLISTGMSSLSAVEALREENASVEGLVAIFTYAFPEAEEAFRDAKVPFDTVTNYPNLLDVALEEGVVSEDTLSTLKAWRKDPRAWRG